jgi:hypothetical protein
VSGVLSAGSSATVQINGFVRIKDQLLIHNGANTAQDAYLQCIGSGVLTVGNTLLINTTTVVSGYNFQVNDQSWLNNFSVGMRNAAATSTDYPWLFLTNGGAGGIRPAEYGHVFLQSRSSASRGIGFITGTTPTERMWINGTDGYVGIATNNPVRTLDIRSDVGVLIKGASSSTDATLSLLPASGGRQYDFRNYGSSFGIKDASADVIRMFFHYNGNIGILNTDPSYALDVTGTINSSTSTISGTGTLNLGTTNVPRIAGRITASSSPSYAPTGKLGFSVTTWGVGTDYGPTEVMAIDMRGSDSKNPVIWMNPFGGSVGIGTTTPSNTALQVQADWVSGFSTVRLQGSASNQVGIGLYNTSGQRRGVWAYTGTEVYFETENSSTSMNFTPNGTSSMVLAGNGEISIGRATSGVTQRDIFINPTSGSPAIYFGRLSSTNDDNTKVYFQNRVGTAAMFVNTGGQQVGIRTTSPQRSLHLAAGGYFLLGGNLYNSYTSDGLWGATATPNFIQTTAYGGTYSFNGGGGLVLGYEDNGAGLYSPAYGFEVKSTDGIPVAGRVVRSIVMKDIDRNTFPLIIYNNGKTFMGEGAGYGRLDVSTSTNEAICVGVNSNTVSSGDLIGALSFVSRDGSTYSAGGVANIRSYATATYNTGNVSADLRFYVSESLQNTGNVPLFGTERMRIHSNGRVAVGDSVETANGILQVRGAHVSGYGLINMNSTDSCILSMDSSGSYDIRLRYKYNGGDKWYVGMRLGDDYEIRNSTDALAVKVNQSADIFMPNRLQVGSTGGFASSSAKFLVGDIISSGSGAIAQFNGFLRIRDQIIIHRDSNTAQEIGLQCTGANALTASGSITATSFFESSDIRLKSNINDFSIDVSSIKAKIYEKDGKVEVGYLAQDVENILSGAVSKRDNGYLDLSYRQVHTAKIAALEQRIKELEEQLKNK